MAVFILQTTNSSRRISRLTVISVTGIKTRRIILRWRLQLFMKSLGTNNIGAQLSRCIDWPTFPFSLILLKGFRFSSKTEGIFNRLSSSTFILSKICTFADFFSANVSSANAISFPSSTRTIAKFLVQHRSKLLARRSLRSLAL